MQEIWLIAIIHETYTAGFLINYPVIIRNISKTGVLAVFSEKWIKGG